MKEVVETKRKEAEQEAKRRLAEQRKDMEAWLSDGRRNNPIEEQAVEKRQPKG